MEDLFLSSLNDTSGQTPEFFSTWSFPEGWVMMTVGFPKLNGQREGEKERQKTNTNLDGNWNAFCDLILEVKTTILLVTLAKHGTLWEMTLRGVTARRWVIGSHLASGCCASVVFFTKWIRSWSHSLLWLHYFIQSDFHASNLGWWMGREAGVGIGMGNTCKSMAFMSMYGKNHYNIVK